MLRTEFCALLILTSATLTANSFAESIPLKVVQGTHVVPVRVNGKVSLDFVIDSGAADVSIPADVFSVLVRTGTVGRQDELGSQIYVLADGSSKRIDRFVIQSLRVGGLEILNIVGAITPAGSPLLLGQSFLRRVGSWSIDNERNVLLLEKHSGAKGTPTNMEGLPPSTEEWELLGRSMAFGPKYPGPWEYVGVTRIQIDGDTRQAWFKSAPARSPASDAHMAWKQTLTLRAFNCKNRTGATIMIVDERVNGIQKTINFLESQVEWRPVVPNSKGEASLRFVCNW